MGEPSDNIPRRTGRAWVPYVIGGISALLTALSAGYVWYAGWENDKVRFHAAVERTVDAIDDRLMTYTALLRGTAGLFYASDEVTFDEFHEYVARLRMNEFFPGAQGIGVAEVVPPDQRAALEERLRGRGIPGFQLHPAGERELYTAITYLEPLDRRNQAALGYDMFSDPVRRAAMERARDSAAPAASGPLTLVQEIDDDKQVGFLVYVPIYRGSPTPATPTERRQRLMGFAYSPFRARDLFVGVLGEPHPEMDLRLTDVTVGPEQVLYATAPRAQGTMLSESRVLEVAGRTWRADVSVGRQFVGGSAQFYAPFILVAGLGASGLLYALSRGQFLSRRLAERAAEELRRSEQSARISEERFRTLFEQAPMSIQTFAPDGSALRANRAWELLWDASRSTLAQYNLATDPQLERLGLRPQILRALAGDAVVLPPIAYDPVRTAGVGRRRWVEGSIYPMRREDGAIGELVLMLLDVTERRNAESERADLLAREREARREAEAANRLKDEFLATVSHELRTPLNAIMGWAQVLQMSGTDGPERGEALEAIVRNARAQAQLVEDLLDVSRIITGKLRLEMRVVDLRDVIASAIETVRPTADARDIRLSATIDPSAGRVQGDAGRLQQVIWNLLSNAIKFTQRGGQVDVCLSREQSNARLTVQDNGRGIAPGFVPYVFNAFRQADATTTRTYGGLGLGLAIVRHLVELHGGTVEAHSDGEGRGSRFIVDLPLAALAAPSAAAPQAVASVDAQPLLGGTKLLVVEDDAEALLLLERMLTGAGAQVRTAPTARQGLELLELWRPDLLLSDIGMPNEDGYWLIERVRQLPPERGGLTPAVALTAFARMEDRRRVLLAGFGAHISKPSEPTELVRTIATLLGRAVSGAPRSV